MDDYISRADAIEAVGYEIDDGYNAIVDRIKALPSTDAVQGEWIEYTDCEGKTRTITCSKCGWVEHSWIDLNYCPSCGSRMKGGAE